MNKIEMFRNFEAVVNVRTHVQYERFMEFCKKLRLEGAGQFMKRISFHDLHTDCGIQKYMYGEMCIEYQPGKGFTMGPRKDYEDYGVEVFSVDEIMSI